MITGVYLPEMNGAVLQCNQLIKNLGDTVNFTILTSTNKELGKGCEYINGVKVYRVFMPKDNKIIYILGAYQFYIFLIQSLKKINLIHLHGFSKRNALVILIGFIYRKKINLILFNSIAVKLFFGHFRIGSVVTKISKNFIF